MEEMYSVLANDLGFSKICMLEVNHCQQSYAGLLLTNNELSNQAYGNILYSGDTIPCNNLRNYAAVADLLIHEATLQAGMEEEAARKMHTTTSQALDIATSCGV